jgi:hypothetical protein
MKIFALKSKQTMPTLEFHETKSLNTLRGFLTVRQVAAFLENYSSNKLEIQLCTQSVAERARNPNGLHKDIK